MAVAGSSRTKLVSTGGLSNAEVIASARVSTAPSVYVLGCLEERVTLYSQQVRALNLVSALVDEGIIKSKSKVAIIGGGAAGITAAAALALSVPDLKLLDVYERRPDLLHLQLKSPHRYLHPHLYDWPGEGSLRLDAGLPLLNWSAGSAEQVANELQSQFESISDRNPLLRVKRRHNVEKVHAFPGGGCRVYVTDNPLAGDFYNVALLSVGFGYERLTDGEINHSYWHASLMSGPLRGDASEYRIMVSGNGDGGLVDFVTAAFNGMSQEEIYAYITGHDGFEEAKRVLLEVEEEAWAPGASLDIYAEYKKRIPATLPINIWLEVFSNLRQDAKIWFHTQTEHLFRKETAILNRFAAYLALAADHATDRLAIRLVSGVEIAGDPLGKQVTFRDGSSFDPAHRFLRFGPDKHKNFQPFKAHIDAVASDRGTTPAGYRPATPPLTASAVARFASPPPVAAHLAGGDSKLLGKDARELAVCLRLADDGQAVWSSALSASDARKLWADGAPELALSCYMTPDEAGPLRFVVARLILHSRSYRLRCRDGHAWSPFLSAFVGDKRPGPNSEFKFQVRPSGDEPKPSAPSEIAGLDELAHRVHLSLDFDVLERLALLVERCLHPSIPTSMGWPIEPKLRARMLARWHDWYAKLLSSEARRRRFLVLLASPDDDSDVGVSGLVRVGPLYVEPHLLRATLLALAFAVCTDMGVDPSASFPGNLAGDHMSAHALGVAWLDGEDVGPRAGSRRWSTNLVLLSELKEPPLLEPYLPRLDRNSGGRPGITDVPSYEQPLIVGCGHVVQTALRSGEASVRGYFSALLQERARAAAAMLE